MDVEIRSNGRFLGSNGIFTVKTARITARPSGSWVRLTILGFELFLLKYHEASC